jgi:hypothetical protein
MFRELQSRISTTWCSLAHKSIMWPVHGRYECRACGRTYAAFAEAPIRGREIQTATSGVVELPAASGVAAGLHHA